MPAMLLAIVITACVSLPERQQAVMPAVTQPVVPAPATQEGPPPVPVPVAAGTAADPAAAPAQRAVQTATPEATTQGTTQATTQATTQGTTQATTQASTQASTQAALEKAVDPVLTEKLELLCDQIGNKLSSVSVEDCLQQRFHFGGAFSIKQRPLMIKDLLPVSETGDHFRVLLIGGIHGDEYSSISIVFKWLELFSHGAREGDFHWRIAPLANPDGLLDGTRAQRQNARGVDLNRNFPSGDWQDKAAQYWQANTGSNPRRFPGAAPASEPEVQWIVNQIEEFNPDVIISVHAPYHLLDFDGPAEAPQRIGELHLHQLGVYPGSLGNYAGLDKQIPVVTLELPSAGILPKEEQIRLMWRDLVAWLDSTGRKNLASRQ